MEYAVEFIKVNTVFRFIVRNCIRVQVEIQRRLRIMKGGDSA
jgi:hypothetical protein